MLIGIDLGGTEIKAGLVDFNGNIIRQNLRPTNITGGYSTIIKDIKEQVEELLIVEGIDINYIRSIGIGIPGIALRDTGKVIICPNLMWENIELGNDLRKIFDKKIYVENDANVAAKAESLFGSTSSYKNSFFITIGTGVGSGIIINKNIYSGSHALGSEIGHMIVGENFYNCNCGNNGCLETFASATAIIKYSAFRINENGSKSLIMDMAENNIKNITAKIIFDAAKLGDELAIEVVNRLCKYLAIGILNIYNLFDPDIIALGGGISKSGDFLLNRIKEKVNKMTFAKNAR